MTDQAVEDRTAELLLRWEEAFDHGDDLPAEELCAGSPELLEPLKQRIAALKQLAWVKDDATTKQPPELHEVSLPKILADRYQIEGLIAEGGHGQVYRAFDQELQRLVAIKVARRRNVPAEDLLEEARRVARLRHPGIVAVHDVGRHEGMLFVVSDLIEGKSLAEAERPSLSESVSIVGQVAEALHFAHQQGFVHRDIKPGNILLDAEGRPLITDFGIATTTEELGDGRATSVGTLPYMAPEQVAGEAQLIDRRTDIYALGVVLYELLTGRLPYQARTPTALREQILFRSPARIGQSLPEALEAVCLKSLAKHPADRYATAEDLAVELRAALNAPHPRNWRWLIVAGIAILVILAGFGAWSLLRTGFPARAAHAFVENGSLRFDGRTRIVTPLERFAPVTLEARICPDPYEKNDFQFLIGSDIATHHGVGLALCGPLVATEYLHGNIFSDQPVMPGKWSHLAAVFGEKETRLYLNGKLVSTGPATESAGGTHFVVGCIGEENTLFLYHGQIRAVRISKGERFIGDFQPDEKFQAADETAILIYVGQSVEGNTVRDLTGHGNDGRVQRF